MAKQKYALVLSGGAFKGAFQLGALQYLRDNWRLIDPDYPTMRFDLIAGVSVGALNGALTAMNELDQLESLWTEVATKGVGEIYTSDFIESSTSGEVVRLKLNFDQVKTRLFPGFGLNFGDYLRLVFDKKRLFRDLLNRLGDELQRNLPKFKSIADNTPLRRKLQGLIDRRKIGHTKFYCGYVSLDTGEYRSVLHSAFVSDQDFIHAILASTAMPIVWEPVTEIAHVTGTDRNAMDGGIRNVSPLGDVIAEINADAARDTEYTVVIINCSDGFVVAESAKEYNVVQIALRTLSEIAITEIFNNDIDQFLRINSILRQLKENNFTQPVYDYDSKTRSVKTGKKLKQFETIIIQPTLSLGDPLAHNDKLHNSRVSHGIEQARQAVAAKMA